MKINFADVPTEGGGSANPLPAGWYQMTIEKSELKTSENKPEAGRMLSLTLRVDENVHPEFANRRAFHRLCFEHQNKTPREIAMRQMSQIVHSIPRLAETLEFDPDEPEELLGETLMVRLKVRPEGNGFEASNDVTAYGGVGKEKPNTSSAAEAAATSAPRPRSIEQPAQGGIGAGATAPRPAATGMKAPWGKK